MGWEVGEGKSRVVVGREVGEGKSRIWVGREVGEGKVGLGFWGGSRGSHLMSTH